LDIQKIIINQLLKNKEYRSTAIATVLEVPYIFKDNNYRNIIKFMKIFYEEKKMTPTKDDLILYIENDTTLNEKDYTSFKSTLMDIVKTKYDFSVNNLKDQTLTFVKDSLTMILLEKAADVLNGLNKKESLESIQLDMRKIVDLSFDDDLGISLDDLEIFNEYDEDRVPMGWLPIDKLLGGGIPKATMLTLLASAHQGKSQLMMYLAVQSAMKGKNIIYVSCEMRNVQTRQRIDSIALRIATLKLTPKEMKYVNYVELWKEARKKIAGNIYLKYYPSGTSDANMISKYIEDLKHKRNFIADLLVYDSLNLGRPIDRRVTKTNKVLFMESITIDFRQMIDDQNISMLTAIQINREGTKELELGQDANMHTISEFFSLSAYSDAIISIKKLYRDDDMFFNDKGLTKPLEESLNNEIDLSLLDKEYSNIVKLMILKSRFGTVVNSYVLVGSNEKYSSYVDLNEKIKLRNKRSIEIINPLMSENKAKEELNKAKEQFKQDNGNEVETYRNKRRHI
jgi:archaellum biogenesis ATPase FlaH